jgi:hypothetical protein
MEKGVATTSDLGHNPGPLGDMREKKNGTSQPGNAYRYLNLHLDLTHK